VAALMQIKTGDFTLTITGAQTGQLTNTGTAVDIAEAYVQKCAINKFTNKFI